jgi:hypothetical protein
MARRTATRKPCYRQVKAAPEKMHSAGLANEARAKDFEYAVGLHKQSPKAVCISRIVGGMNPVIGEWKRIRHLVGMLIDMDKNVQLLELAEKMRVKISDSLRLEPHLAFSAIARRYTQHVVYKIKINLKNPCVICDRRRGEGKPSP